MSIDKDSQLRSMLAILLAVSLRALEELQAHTPVMDQLVTDLERVIERTRGEIATLDRGAAAL